MQVQIQPADISKLRPSSQGAGLAGIKGASMTPAQNNPIKPNNPALAPRINERVANRTAIRDEEISNRTAIRDSDIKEQDMIRAGARSKEVREEGYAREDLVEQDRLDNAARITAESNTREDQLDATAFERAGPERRQKRELNKNSIELTQMNLRIAKARAKATRTDFKIKLRKDIAELKNSMSEGVAANKFQASLDGAIKLNQTMLGQIGTELHAAVIDQAAILNDTGDGELDDILELVDPNGDFQSIIKNAAQRKKLAEYILNDGTLGGITSIKNQSIEKRDKLKEEGEKLLELRAKARGGKDIQAKQELLEYYQTLVAEPRNLAEGQSNGKVIKDSVEALNNPPPPSEDVRNMLDSLPSETATATETMIWQQLIKDGVIKQVPESPEEVDAVPPEAFKNAMSYILGGNKSNVDKEQNRKERESLERDKESKLNPEGPVSGPLGDLVSGTKELISGMPEIPDSVTDPALAVGTGVVVNSALKENGVARKAVSPGTYRKLGNDISTGLNRIKPFDPGQMQPKVDAFRATAPGVDSLTPNSDPSLDNKLKSAEASLEEAERVKAQTPRSQRTGSRAISQKRQKVAGLKNEVVQTQKWKSLNEEIDTSHKTFAKTNGLQEFDKPKPSFDEGPAVVNKWRDELFDHYNKQAQKGRESLTKQVFAKYKNAQANKPWRTGIMTALSAGALVGEAWQLVKGAMASEDDPEVKALVERVHALDVAHDEMIEKAIIAEQEYIQSLNNQPEEEVNGQPSEAPPLDDSNSSVGSWLDSAVNLEENNTLFSDPEYIK